MTAPRVLHVLIVDDDDADVLMIEEALQECDPAPTMHRVEDGAEALDYLHRRGSHQQAQRPDLVLLDLNMPRLGGQEVLEKMKTDEGLRAIPVVVLTTSYAAPDVLASYRRHANAFVTKPMDLDAFEAAVQTIQRFYRDVATLPT